MMGLFKKKKKSEETINPADIGEQEESEPAFTGQYHPEPEEGTTIEKKFLIIAGFLAITIFSYVIAVNMEEPEKQSKKNSNEEMLQQTSLSGKGKDTHRLMDGTKDIPTSYGDSKQQDKNKLNDKKIESKVEDRYAAVNRNAPISNYGGYVASNYAKPGSYNVNNSSIRTSIIPTTLQKTITEAEKEVTAALKSFTRFKIASDYDGSNKASANENSQHDSNAKSNDNDEENLDFIDKNRRPSTSFYLPSVVQAPISEFEVKAGTNIPGVLITGINSDLRGEIVAQVREDVFDSVTGNYLLIPMGARLIGNYETSIGYAQNRVLVAWNRLIFPDGSSIDLQGMIGTDTSGYAGLKDKVNNHTPRVLNAILIGSLLTAGARIATGGIDENASFSQLAGSGIAENILNATTRITEKNLNIKPTIEIPPGKPFNIFVNKDMVLKPYISD